MTTDPPSWEDALGDAVKPGEVLVGKYRVERVIGAGGMGVVVEARHLQLDERVAVKFLRGKETPDAHAVARFTQEAKATFKIKSEHAAKIFDIGTLADGWPYMVMEFLAGMDLQQLLTQKGQLDIEQAVGYVLQACEAVAEAHSYGIVHRDLKPENLFLAQQPDGVPSIKVLDFGISKLSRETKLYQGRSLTGPDAVMGSPCYMAPEQWASARDVDSAADQWALGVVLFELITGTVPFRGDNIAEVCRAVLNEPLPPINDLRSDVPAKLDQIIERCVHKDPTQRYDNLAELALALRTYGPDGAQSCVSRAVRVLQKAGQAAANLETANADTLPERNQAALAEADPLRPTSVERNEELPLSQPSPIRTAESWQYTSPGTKNRKSRATLVGGALAALVLGGGIMHFWNANRTEPPVTIGSGKPAPQATTTAASTTTLASTDATATGALSLPQTSPSKSAVSTKPIRRLVSKHNSPPKVDPQTPDAGPPGIASSSASPTATPNSTATAASTNTSTAEPPAPPATPTTDNHDSPETYM